MSMQCADEWLHAETAVGAQIGLTLCPRQFNGVYNLHVDQWVQDEKERDGHQTWHDTVNPITGTKHDLALNSFMDDITRTHTVIQGASTAHVTEQLNGATGRLEARIGRGGW
eukprot:4565179-Pyramimonas_sp.AAC.1